MWYLLKVYALVAALVLSTAGVLILTLWVGSEVKALAGVSHRLYARVATLTGQPRFFANPLAISRPVSRNGR
jgi:hypothetical protein